MRKLFSGNADVVAVFAIVLTIGVGSALHRGLSLGRAINSRIMTRVPARLERIPERLERVPARLRRRIPVRLRLADFAEQRP